MMCKDCGAREYTPSKSRGDVCVGCMDTRGELVKLMMDGKITQDEFKSIQGGRHTRNSKIVKLLAKVKS